MDDLFLCLFLFPLQDCKRGGKYRRFELWSAVCLSRGQHFIPAPLLGRHRRARSNTFVQGVPQLAQVKKKPGEASDPEKWGRREWVVSSILTKALFEKKFCAKPGGLRDFWDTLYNV